MRSAIPLVLFLVALGASACVDVSPPRALVADLQNASRDRRFDLARVATNVFLAELTKRGVYEVIARPEVLRAAEAHRMRAPYSKENLLVLAKETKAALLVTGEIRHIVSRTHHDDHEVEVGLIVRVRDMAMRELINGAAERGFATGPADTGRQDTLVMEAAEAAAKQAAERIATYKPIAGVLFGSSGNYPGVLINVGSRHGVKERMDFIVVRDGVRVGKLRVQDVYPDLAGLKVVENTLGIRPEDKAIAIFPEPKFAAREERTTR